MISKHECFVFIKWNRLTVIKITPHVHSRIKPTIHKNSYEGMLGQRTAWPANTDSVICTFVLKQMRAATANEARHWFPRALMSKHHQSPLEDHQDLHGESWEPSRGFQSYHLWNPHCQWRKTKQVRGVLFGVNHLVGDSKGPAELGSGKSWSFTARHERPPWRQRSATVRAMATLRGEALYQGTW